MVSLIIRVLFFTALSFVIGVVGRAIYEFYYPIYKENKELREAAEYNGRISALKRNEEKAKKQFSDRIIERDLYRKLE